MNEFREALTDQSKTFITRNEFSLCLEKIESDIRSLRESRSELQGKASQSQVNIALSISVIGIALGFLSLLLKIL